MKYIDNIEFGFYKNLDAIQVWSGSENSNEQYFKDYIDVFLNILQGKCDYSEFLIGSENGIIYSISSDGFNNLKRPDGEIITSYNLIRHENNIVISSDNEADKKYLHDLIFNLLSYDFSNLLSEYEVTNRYNDLNKSNTDKNISKELIQLIKIQANPSYIKWLIDKSDDLFYFGNLYDLQKIKSKIFIGFELYSISFGLISFKPKFEMFNSLIDSDLYDKNANKKASYKFRKDIEYDCESFTDGTEDEFASSSCDLCGGNVWCGTDNCPLDPT